MNQPKPRQVRRRPPSDSISKREYILQDRDGHYVAVVESTGFETIKLRFLFVRKEVNAKRFTYDDLFSPLAAGSIGQEFARGYSGGRLIRVK